MIQRSIVLFLILIAVLSAGAQHEQNADSTQTPLLISPEKYLAVVTSKAKGIEEKLDKKSQKALAQYKAQEAKLIKKLSQLDSSAAQQLLQSSKAKFQQLEDQLKNPGKLSQYIPGLDSLGTTLNFLQANNPLLSQAKEAKEKLGEAISKVDALKLQLQKAETIKQFLKERKELLQQSLEKFGLVRELKQINKQVYYYAQQLNEYKAILKDPKKIERKALELLSKTKLWQEFFRKNSMLASLFRLPGGDPNDPANMASLAGLQTRAQVNSIIQTQLTAGGPNAQQQLQQNVQAAQAQLNQLKNKVLQMGGGSLPAGQAGSDVEMPEGFKPNNQKTKTFLQRLEYGANIQSQKANNFFPVTSDIGLSLGYKLNDKSVIGIGASYKLGWGRGWNHIRLSSEGLGLRSYVDVKLRGSLWISGGYEQNYRTAFSDFEVLRNRSGWQQSGLVGLSKVISLKTKLFKKTSVKLLWDFMSYQQVPRTQPVVFRVGYNF
jgi:hypothetical protein